MRYGAAWGPALGCAGLPELGWALGWAGLGKDQSWPRAVVGIGSRGEGAAASAKYLPRVLRACALGEAAAAHNNHKRERAPGESAGEGRRVMDEGISR